MKNPIQVSKSGAACAILGLLAYRAGHSFSDRPAEFEHPWQLDAWQQGWATGYDCARHHMEPKQAYSLAWITLHNDINPRPQLTRVNGVMKFRETVKSAFTDLRDGTIGKA